MFPLGFGISAFFPKTFSAAATALSQPGMSAMTSPLVRRELALGAHTQTRTESGHPEVRPCCNDVVLRHLGTGEVGVDADGEWPGRPA